MCGEGTEEPIVLCDGSDRLRFSGTNHGGNVTGVPRVALEVGWSFLLVDGACRYWSMTEPDGPIRTGMLDEAQETAFARELELGSWSSGPGSPGGCVDASGVSLRFLDEELMAEPCTANRVTDAYQGWLETLHASGAPLNGEVRYSVADASNDGWVVGNTTNIASSWPLQSDPEDALVAPEAEESAEPSIASSEDAEALRGARDAYVARAPATGPWLRVPLVLEVAGAEPRYYNLAMRDVTPFERDGELAPDDFFAP